MCVCVCVCVCVCAGVDNYAVHRISRSHLLLLLRLPRREGQWRRFYKLCRCPLVGRGKCSLRCVPYLLYTFLQDVTFCRCLGNQAGTNYVQSVVFSVTQPSNGSDTRSRCSLSLLSRPYSQLVCFSPKGLRSFVSTLLSLANHSIVRHRPLPCSVL